METRHNQEIQKLKAENALLKEKGQVQKVDSLKLELENQKNRTVAAKRTIEALQT